MNLESLFTASPLLGGFVVLCLWFYTQIQKIHKEMREQQAQFHTELMEMQCKQLVSNHEMTTAVANNTHVMQQMLNEWKDPKSKRTRIIQHHPV